MNWRNMSYTLLAALLLALLVSGCVAATAVPATTTPVPPTATVESPTATPIPPTATLIPTVAKTVSPTNTPGATKPTPKPLPTTEQDCRQQGGTWGPQGMLGRNMCNLPTIDAGQSCTDPSQCEGTCLGGTDPTATSGTCSPYTLNFGCYPIVQGGVPMMICVD